MSDFNPNDLTREQQDSSACEEDSAPDECPARIGRYRIESVLGKGGFGLVYLAQDEQLDRAVAVKVPHASRISKPEDALAYLTEARTVANLDHPNIVPVHDVGSNDECPCYVVSKYVEGVSLSTKLKKQRLKFWEAAELVASVAEALHHAHKQGLVHRDVKPGNILIGIDGKPYVVDFGLALKEENVGRGPRYAGTPAYMSPEQARGEGHRVDGRSDIFSLGVVFYQLLVGRRPFRGDTQAELLEQVTSFEARPLRQYDERLPKELARICDKAMAKRASERYSSAHDLADDLRHFLAGQTFSESGVSPDGIGFSATEMAASETLESQTASTSEGLVGATSASNGLVSLGSQPIKIVPKGLRSFDAHDADFFLELLPGPRDRDGLPDSLRFWKIRIEESDPDKTCAVGLIYGPSGCGKSSLVKAGLLPRLSSDVICVYIESTLEETETRLLNGLRKCCPKLDDNLDLKATLAALRRGQGIPAGKKLLIVLDQFEQWLHARKDENNTELVQALRQCDGGKVQCIVMVRDDFWLAVSRFLRALEIRLVEGHNVALADLFDLNHAKRVLAAFGRAFGKLPENIEEMTQEQRDFLKRSVAGLAEEGKVICVRLALFAEMMKGKQWTAATFKEVGGTQGLGVTFLEETFSSPSASPQHRYHQKAARAVLNEMLPDSGTNIKGYMRSYNELMRISSYQNRPGDFDELIRILDSEVRLITPTDPEGAGPEGQPHPLTEPGKKYFQLAHDYLVPSLRDWLTRKQQETKRGRAELRLFDRSVAWNVQPENRYLPSWWGFFNIRLFTDKKKWTQPQRKMMGTASVVYGIRSSIFALLLTVIVIGSVMIGRQRDAEATRLVEGLLQAETSQVESIIENLADYRTWTNDELVAAYDQSSDESNAKLHAALALLPEDDSVLPFLKKRLLHVSPVQFEHVSDLLAKRKTDLTTDYWSIANDPTQEPAVRFQAACALANYDSENEQWENQNLRQFVAGHLVRVLPSHLLPWRNALRPVHVHLTPSLAAIYRNQSEGEQVRAFATDALADYLSEDPDGLFDLLADAEQKQFTHLFDQLARHRDRAVELAVAEIAKTTQVGATESDKEFAAMRQANAAVSLIRMNVAEPVWPLLKHSSDPRVRSYIIHWLSPRGAGPASLTKRFKLETNVTVKRALLLSLGEYDLAQFADSDRDSLVQRWLAVYRVEPDAGLHAAAEWLLRKWGQAEAIDAIDQHLKLKEEQRTADRWSEIKWYINGAGQTFVVLDAGEIQMGSPPTEPNHYANEQMRLRRINRRVAFSTKQVTKGQWREFCKSNEHEYNADKESLQQYILTDDSPMIAITWFEAAEYCNWLSKQEGIKEDQWCFEPNEDGEFAPGMKAKDNFLELSGYRLATEPEWEFACRAGATTSRFYGLSVNLLSNYAWFARNNENHTQPVGTKKPNDFGLFDMQGNAFDWCYNRVEDADAEVVPEDDVPSSEPVSATDNRILRGGSFVVPEANVRSAARYFNQPATRRLGTSFRVVRSLPGKRIAVQ